MISKETIYTWLEEVKDPEIPVLSLVDLGVITDVVISDQVVNIEITPTFTGCPALDIMRSEIVHVLETRGLKKINVSISYRIPWTSDRISEKGKTALKKFGISPPPGAALFTDLDILPSANCPVCEGTDTDLRSVFGSTLCRSIYYCRTCRETFEQFKPI